MKKLLLLTAAVALFGATARTANAQATGIGTTSATVPASAQLTIGSILFINIDINSITFPTPDANDFTAGLIDANETSTLTYFGNVPHDVEIKANAGAFTPTGGSTYSKPASDFEYSVDGGAFTPISTTAADVVNGNPAGGGTTTMDYQVLLNDALDVPGTYTLGFTYTVVPN
jgi:hypothetical protein